MVTGARAQEHMNGARHALYAPRRAVDAPRAPTDGALHLRRRPGRDSRARARPAPGGPPVPVPGGAPPVPLRGDGPPAPGPFRPASVPPVSGQRSSRSFASLVRTARSVPRPCRPARPCPFRPASVPAASVPSVPPRVPAVRPGRVCAVCLRPCPCRLPRPASVPSASGHVRAVCPARRPCGPAPAVSVPSVPGRARTARTAAGTWPLGEPPSPCGAGGIDWCAAPCAA